MTSVVEIVVRFGGTIIDVAHVAANGAYRIGTAPSVDLPVIGSTCFPLIDQLVLRAPAGTPACRTIDGRKVAIDASMVRLLPGFEIELELGAITIAIAVVPPSRTELPRPSLDRRLPAYLAVALVAHLAMWAVAEVRTPPPEMTIAPRPPPRVMRIASREPAPHAVTQRSDEEPAPGPPPPRPRTRRSPPSALESARLLARTLGDMHVADALDQAGLYVEADAPRFGGARQFDPATRAGFASIATGRYETISNGPGTGDDFDLPTSGVHVAICESECAATGALGARLLRGILEAHARELAACGASGETTDLAIDNDARGRVRHASSSAAFGHCIEQVARSITVPAASGDTTLTAGLAFR